MTQEEKQLLIKDLCARLPYDVKVHFGTDDKNFDTDLVGLTSNITTNIHNIENYETIEECFIWNIKPYLRPMSSMTDEEKILMATICLKYANGDVEGVVSELSDFYNSRHLDYHGLIGRGLALEAKEGMYKTE